MTVPVHHEVMGPAGGPPVVFSGSIGSDLRMWESQAEALAAAGFRVVRYDHRGHGRSPVPAGPYSLESLASDVLALLDRLGLTRVSWVGLSLGGMIGMWLAEHVPHRLDRLVLCCTSAALGTPEMWQERARMARESGMDSLADATLGRWLTPEFRASSPSGAAMVRDMFTSQPAEGYASCCAAIEKMSIVDSLSSITVPTLVISTADDPSTPPDHGRRIAAAIPGARLEIVERAAHLGNIEQPALFTGLILSHVRPDRHALGMTVRRSVLGDEHVSAAVAGTTEFTHPFDAYITESAWGTVWSRPGLDRRTRSAITLALLTMARAHDELPMHVRAARQHGLTEAEIAEILLHTAVYAGAPAARAAFAIAKSTLEDG